MVSECQNERADGDCVQELKEELLLQMGAGDEGGAGGGGGGTIMHPAESYMALFGEILDPWLQGKIQKHYRNAWTGKTRAKPGFVYVFRDNRDPYGIVKVGSTGQRDPHKRINQWRKELRDPKGEHVTMLFAERACDAVLCERTLHTLLWCRQLPARIHRKTGSRLVEYFHCPDHEALRMLVKACVKHADNLARHPIYGRAAPS